MSISPNMNLVLPTVGVTPGPQYATNLNASLTIIDQHDHTSGNGVPIPSAGININADLGFNSYNAVDMRTSRYTSQIAPLADPLDIICVYAVAGDLYFNDGVGNQVRITQSGGVAGSPGSIANLVSPASASYLTLSGTFVWESDANVPALMDNGSVIVREPVANGNGATIKVAAGLAGNYNLILPQLPASQKIMTLDASGNLSAPYDVDGSSIVISSNLLTVGPTGITTSMIAAGAVTEPKLANASVSTRTFVAGAITTTAIDNGAVTPQKRSTAIQAQSSFNTATTSASGQISLAATGRPIVINLSITGPNVQQIGSSGALTLALYRGNVLFLTLWEVGGTTTTNYAGFTFIDDNPGTGTTLYDLRTNTGSVSPAAGALFRLSAWEL